ncbi:BolA family protein [Ferrimonas balearica DSM 9799]|uniref:BolA family protein n=1 Tax=Ferrimonas balearica (strain DSM 9799 / CCM 4581 / KCTC 23876 / PAT) TaxID=550540 RepID=E1SMB9_FERBD|nr:BolA family protein [Ferrimonas balearica]MBY6019086.1 BolA family transcriptional regulator [Halomonas denitrificans]ADN77628.1 BolA family protein [Ferrimonas balearica DSM 9799]MBW3141009.1 BolA family transcriptional regulator [Ferrimonas balearica]MBW3165791.1 BolA family transcriptional regulator [Ferrimonas balearica]MBY5981701.1 BolA family transcriptional regulator [Ferrimonas balearica]
MEPKEIEARLQAAMTLAEVRVTADGSHYTILAVGDCFDGLTKVRRQQSVYAPLMDKVTDGTLHALTIKAFTPAEWQREKIFNG